MIDRMIRLPAGRNDADDILSHGVNILSSFSGLHFSLYIYLFVMMLGWVASRVYSLCHHVSIHRRHPNLSSLLWPCTPAPQQQQQRYSQPPPAYAKDEESRSLPGIVWQPPRLRPRDLERAEKRFGDFDLVSGTSRNGLRTAIGPHGNSR
ncbi:unnamed protein product [Lampetra planeri]